MSAPDALFPHQVHLTGHKAKETGQCSHLSAANLRLFSVLPSKLCCLFTILPRSSILKLFLCRFQVLSSRCFRQKCGNYQRRQWQPTPVFLPGESHGWRSLVGCSPWGRGESDTTERLHFHFSLSCIGEGNGNPLKYSCLENPRDGGVWWAAIYGVAQSRT